MILLVTLFGALGTVVGIYAKSFDHHSFVNNILILPLTFLGGVFYSIEILPPFWEAVSHANPLFYIVNAIRFGFLGSSDVSVLLSFAVTAAMTAALRGLVAVAVRERSQAEALSGGRGRRCPRATPSTGSRGASTPPWSARQLERAEAPEPALAAALARRRALPAQRWNAPRPAASTCCCTSPVSRVLHNHLGMNGRWFVAADGSSRGASPGCCSPPALRSRASTAASCCA